MIVQYQSQGIDFATVYVCSSSRPSYYMSLFYLSNLSFNVKACQNFQYEEAIFLKLLTFRHLFPKQLENFTKNLKLTNTWISVPLTNAKYFSVVKIGAIYNLFYWSMLYSNRVN